MLERGICYVAMGADYLEQCRESVARLRHYSDLPVVVTTDFHQEMPEGRGWPDGVSLRIVRSLHRRDSRSHKIGVLGWSPFARTLYLDTDTAVMRGDFVEAFDWLNCVDVLFSIHGDYVEHSGTPLPPGYAELIEPFHLRWPLRIYKGGCWLCRSTPASRRFFAAWLHVWEWYGMARDMPPMMAAAQLARPLSIGELPPKWESHDGTHIRHAASGYVVPEVLNIPKYKPEPGRGKEWARCPLNTTPLPDA